MLGTEGLLSGSTKRASSRARQSGLSSQAGQRGLPLGLGKRDLLPGSSQSSSQTRNREHPVGPAERASSQETSSQALYRCLFWGSAERASFLARKGGPPPRLDIQCLLSSSTQRTSPLAQHRGPPLGLGRVGLPSGLAERVSSQTQPLKPSGST